jgi:lactate dehydrogenase-like 2-hydroxyacid dehydrogenase
VPVPTVALTRRLPAEAEAAMAERFSLLPSDDDRQLDGPALRRRLLEADAVVCTVTDRFDARVLAAPTRARMLANFGVGVNHVDLAAARRHGLVVTNTPDVLTDDTADLAIALLLAAMRGMGAGERRVRDGRWAGWAPTADLGTRVSGKTLGVVGFGRIGQAVARRAALGFGMRVLVHSRRAPTPDHPLAAHVTWYPMLDALLVECDAVSLHVPATPDTRHLLDARRLGLLRPSAFLVNTARGDVVDEEALAEALAAGRLAGAGLDVYAREPDVPAALLALDNVVLLPHLGSATRETRVAMGRRVLANLEAFFAGDEPPDRVA